jgi:hypothetical protein
MIYGITFLLLSYLLVVFSFDVFLWGVSDGLGYLVMRDLVNRVLHCIALHSVFFRLI